jgi:hypothetical protein
MGVGLPPPPSPRDAWAPPTARLPAPAPMVASGRYLAPPRKNCAVVVALVTTVSGWAVFALIGMMLLLVDQQSNCTANRGDAYQRCVRTGDMIGLGVRAAVIGLAMVGLVVLLRGRRRRVSTPDRDPIEWKVGAAAVLLVALSIALWVEGARGGWAPERPFRYEPIATLQANLIMMTGVLVGVLVGVLFPLGRDDR